MVELRNTGMAMASALIAVIAMSTACGDGLNDQVSTANTESAVTASASSDSTVAGSTTSEVKDPIAKSLASCCNRYRGFNLENDPIDYSTGELMLKATDFHEPGPQLDFSLVRIFRGHSLPMGSFGVGWAFNLDQRIVQTADGFVLVDDRGNEVSFLKQHASLGLYSASNKSKAEMRVTSADGHVGYDVTLKGSRHELFDADGRLVAISEGDVCTKIDRGPTGAIRTVTDSSGEVFSFESDQAGLITKITVEDEYVWKFSYDKDGLLVRTENPLKNYFLYSYQTVTVNGKPRAAVSSVCYQGKDSYALQYDAKGRVTKRTWKDGENAFDYNEKDKITTVTSRDGSRTTYAYKGVTE